MLAEVSIAENDFSISFVIIIETNVIIYLATALFLMAEYFPHVNFKFSVGFALSNGVN